MRTSPFQSISKNPVISERPIDEARPLKVIFIGAGISGIIAGIKLPQILKNLHLVIYDKNPEIGGTWWENRYPGCACGTTLYNHLTTQI
jgi:cation diffusion facilitator CzcD-associated flavoprotein CzcO